MDGFSYAKIKEETENNWELQFYNAAVIANATGLAVDILIVIGVIMTLVSSAVPACVKVLALGLGITNVASLITFVSAFISDVKNIERLNSKD